MFTKAERASFSYWFAHWCAYNMTALNLKCWKLKYLFHDIEKPWLMLFWRNYNKVQKYHRLHSNHHLEFKDKNKIDWEAMVIDWECSRFTKISSPLSAREVLNHRIVNKRPFSELLIANIPPILDKLKL